MCYFPQLVAACHKKLRQFDDRGLATLANSLGRIGYDVCIQQGPHVEEAGSSTALLDDSGKAVQRSSSSSSNSRSSRSSFLDDLLQAVIKQLSGASSQSCSTLCYSLATLLQQQRSSARSYDLQQQQQQSVLLQQLVGAMASRFRVLAATGQLHSSDASRAALAACRLAKAAREDDAAVALESSLLDEQLQALLQQAVQQAVHAAESTGVQLAAGDAGMLLYSLAKARVRPSWRYLQGLVGQYSLAVQQQAAVVGTAALGSTHSSTARAVQQQKQRSSDTSAAYGAGTSAKQQTANGREYDLAQNLPPTLWAVGRLLELQQGPWKQQKQQRSQQLQPQQQQQMLYQLQSCSGLLKELNGVLLVCSDVLLNMTPVQLALVAAGLAKMMGISSAQVNAAASAAAAAAAVGSSIHNMNGNNDEIVVTQQQQQQQRQQKQQQQVLQGAATAPDPADVQAAAKDLAAQLAAPQLKQLVKQHVARVEGLLQMMPLAQRLQIADAYRLLGVQLPRSVSLVFDRDAAAAAAATTGQHGIRTAYPEPAAAQEASS
jgi:hypothetical protein